MDVEARRSRLARSYLVDGPLTARLETLLTLVSKTLNFPTVRVDVLDEDTQHTISLYGAGDPSAAASTEAFCNTVVQTELPVVVDDAAEDPRFAQLPSVLNGEIGSYLGVPLRGREAMVIGAVCVIDPAHRVIDHSQLQRLTEFGRVVEDYLDSIRRLKEQRIEGSVATDEIARAIRDGEIVPWYQPIVDLATGDLAGFEALARWEHPDRGVDDPRRFIPVAEDSDLIIDVDLAVIRRALADLRRWQETRPDLRISVNLSARHLIHPDSASVLHQAALDAGVDPGSVTLELNEISRVDTADTNIPKVAHQLRAFGFQVWLDDFGTGWSSLDHLLWLSVDGIKIDRAVTVALGTPVGDALTSAAIGLAAALNLRTTIEGVETHLQAVHARNAGCHYGQGYLWGIPTAASAVTFTPRAVEYIMGRTGTPMIAAGRTQPHVGEPAAPAIPVTTASTGTGLAAGQLQTPQQHAAPAARPPVIATTDNDNPSGNAASFPVSRPDLPDALPTSDQYTAVVRTLLAEYQQCAADTGSVRRRSLRQALSLTLRGFWALVTTRTEEHLMVQTMRLTNPDLMIANRKIGELPALWAQRWLQQVSAVQGIRWETSTSVLGRLVVATLDGFLVDFTQAQDTTGIPEMLDVFAYHLSEHAVRTSRRRPPT